jgi:hypothetical protein
MTHIQKYIRSFQPQNLKECLKETAAEQPWNGKRKKSARKDLNCFEKVYSYTMVTYIRRFWKKASILRVVL